MKIDVVNIPAIMLVAGVMTMAGCVRSHKPVEVAEKTNAPALFVEQKPCAACARMSPILMIWHDGVTDKLVSRILLPEEAGVCTCKSQVVAPALAVVAAAAE